MDNIQVWKHEDDASVHVFTASIGFEGFFICVYILGFRERSEVLYGFI